MAQQISDLVINLDVDSATFTEQVARIKNQLSGLGDEAEKVQTRQQRAEAALATAAANRAAAMSDMQSRQSAAAAGLSSEMQRVSESVEETQQRVAGFSQQLRDNAARAAVLAPQQDALAESFFRQIDGVRSLSGATDSLTAVQEQFRKARVQGNITQQDYLALISQTTARQKELQRAEEKASQSRARFLEQLKSQVEEQGLSRTELLNLKAAQLGVTEQAAPLIARLKEQDSEWKKGTLSAGQYRQALRMLPAQFTDIATSIAGGMPLWMVLMQQGGQISDSFGGIGNIFEILKEELLGVKTSADESEASLSENANALSENAEHAKGLLRFLTPGRIIVGGFATALTAVSVAAWQAEQANRSLYRAITITGGTSATTTAQLWKMADEIGDSTNASTASVAEVLARIAGTGKYSTEQLRIVAKTSQQWSQVMEDDAARIEAAFGSIAKSPVKALAELNKEYNFLSVAQLRHIDELERTKGKQAAVTEGMKLFADTMGERMQQIDNASTPLEQMWDNIKKWTADAWRWVGDHTIGALNLITDVVAGTVEQVRYLLNSGDTAIREFVLSAQKAAQKIPGMGDVGKDAIKQNQEYIEANKKQNAELLKSIAERDARIRQGEMGYVTRARDARVAAGPGQQDAVSKAADEIEKNRRKKGQTRTSAGVSAVDSAREELLVLQAQLRTLQLHKGLNDTISQQRKDLWTTEAKFQVLEEAARTRSLTKQEKSLLSGKAQVLQLARQKALLGDQIVAQEQLNKRMDTAQKYVTQMAEKQQALVGGATLSDRMAQRQLAKAQLAAGWKNGGGSLDDAGYRQQLQAANNYYEAEDQLRGNWLSGVEKGWAEYQDSATNVYDAMKQVSQSTFSGLADQLTQLTTTGKASFKEFTSSILKMIVQVINQLIVAYTLQAAMGWISGDSSASKSGQSFAVPSYRPPNYDVGGFTGHGGKYEPAGVVHRGEFVFTKEATSRIGVSNLYRMMRGYASGGYVGNAASPASVSPGGVMVNMGGVYISSSNEQQSTQRSAIDSNGILKQLKPAIISVVSEQAQRPGTPLWKAIKEGR
ncbi:phage tail tape measure protein [Klebsiella pneumoniae]|uniref:phage tail tape measure protein n=1 Tax=Klebsiella pneumoniae TaxID=573 RepID=UPI000E2D074B|nr:phage tail tape measure protein [Klebsiella pneumoniae]SWC67461.1 phage tail tape measure protein, lambda family [Klebsiella pneumoniae]SWE53867.1 phage tail tape measure protein, lambda family [Klebsiella pneumoniae]SWF09269.1 phage tail tape measure protein, lambda family [Klebsiella pneumoniae]